MADELSENDSKKTGECIECCKILSIKEINSASLLYEDRSVRTWGKVISHDIHSQQAIIMDDAGEKLFVNTKKIEPYGFTLGLYYILIGDMIKNEGLESTLMLHARIVTCVDELDIDLFMKTLELRRIFLNEKVS